MPASRAPDARDRGAVWVLLAAVLPYLTAFGNAFVRDDLPLIRDDPRLDSWAGVWQCFTSNYWGAHAQAGLYRPLTLASYALNRSLAAVGPDGPATFGFSLGNIALHAACAWAVWRLARAWGAGARGALAAGLIVAVHPVNTEAVTGLVGRADVAAALCVVLALLAWRRDGRGPRWLALSVLGAGLLFKESAAAGFVLLPLSDLLAPAAPSPLLAARVRRLGRGLPGLLLLGAAWLALRFAVLGRLAPGSDVIHFGANPLAQVPPVVSALGHTYGNHWLEARLTAVALVSRAAGQLLWPATLHGDTSYNQFPTVTSLGDPRLVLGALVMLGVVAGVLCARRRAPLVAFGLAWLAVAWMPVSNLVAPIGTLFAERTLYLPGLGLALAFGAGFERLWRRVPVGSARAWFVALCAALLLAGAARTATRNLDWRDEERFWRATVVTSPDSYEPHVTLGLLLAQRARGGPPVPATRSLRLEALASLESGLAIFPDHRQANAVAAELLWDLGRGPEARRHYERLMRVLPDDPGPLARAAGAALAQARESAGATRQRCLDEAALRLTAALALDPQDPGYTEACFYQGVLLREFLGDGSGAVAWFEQVLQRQPDHPQRALIETWIATADG